MIFMISSFGVWFPPPLSHSFLFSHGCQKYLPILMFFHSHICIHFVSTVCLTLPFVPAWSRCRSHSGWLFCSRRVCLPMIRRTLSVFTSSFSGCDGWKESCTKWRIARLPLAVWLPTLPTTPCGWRKILRNIHSDQIGLARCLPLFLETASAVLKGSVTLDVIGSDS